VPSSLKPGVTTQNNEITATPLEVSGELPQWLSGQLLRTGPARFESGGKAIRHWFDGLAAIDSFSFAGGRVVYDSRYLRTRSLRVMNETGRMPFYDYASDPCVSLFRRFFAMFFPSRCDILTDNANVNIGVVAGRAVAMTETPIPVEFDPETLETLGVISQERQTQGHHTTAHPHYTVDGSAVNYVTRMLLPKPFYRIVTTHTDGRRRELARIPVGEPSYMHSFAMSERYAALVEFPFVVSPYRLAYHQGAFIDAFRWKPERGTRIRVIDLQQGSVRLVAETEPIFGFHHMNAFEEGGSLMIDFAAYRDAEIAHSLDLDHMTRDDTTIPKAFPTRLRVDLNTGSATTEKICDTSIELPRIAYDQVNGRRYRYAYGVSTYENSEYGYNDQLVKVSVQDGEARTWREPGTHPGEPVFLPTPGGDREDAGVVLSVVLDAQRESSFLLVLDAQTFQERARAQAPQRIPFCFHGHFLATGEPDVPPRATV
jgi:beta,beta-carotene 9',10'-dioxygenase